MTKMARPSGAGIVGFVLDRGVAGFESYNADERSLGLFDTWL
jgi:hypothetical protein